MKKLIILITLTLLIPFPMVIAAGLQVSPAKLDFTVNNKSQTSQTITVVNPTTDVQVFEVYADDFANVIKAQPESFTLESGTRKTVKISVDGQNLKTNQSLATNLSVVGKPLADNKFSVGAGAKIPITITPAASAKPKTPYWVLWCAILACLIIISVVTRRAPSQ